MSDKKETAPDGKQAFEENPFNPENRRPEDIVRLFYTFDVPIIPVVSKRGILIGVLKKEDLVSELSDIERVEKMKVDDFVTRVAKKLTLDELLPYGSIKEFVVINIFGDIQGKWSRLQLFTASETPERSGAAADREADVQKEEQILEWMIYLILEHIPRALYAVNINGKTIFYNSHFEDLYRKHLKKDVDVAFVEESIKDPDKNELISGKKSDELMFFNRDLKIHYEKIPLMSKRKKVGFLLFCTPVSDDKSASPIPGIDIKSKSLDHIADAVERIVLVDLLKEKKDLAAVAKSLKISEKSLGHKMKKHGIKWKKEE
jgi:transcriptional regulator with PAS, ATPase and Fis domain